MTDDRYQRQWMLPEIGRQGQRRLSQSRILCIGAGGLGCATLPYLAAAGVGHITVIDDDQVELSNLQRQILFTESDLGRAKSEVAVQRLKQINSEITVVARTERLNSANAQSLFEDHDVVIEGSDNFATKFLAGDAAVKFGVPLIYGSAVGLEAQVSVFDPDDGPCLRCLYPTPPEGWVPNCTEGGVLGPLVGMAGCVQATQAIQLITGETNLPVLEPLIGRLWMVDGRSMESRCLTIRRRPECGLCSIPPEQVHLPRSERASGLDIGPEEARGMDNALFLDIREPDEWEEGHIPGAQNLPLSRLLNGERPNELDQRPCIVYCGRGTRGTTAAQLLAEEGHEQVYHLKGGLAAWKGPQSTPEGSQEGEGL